MPAKSKSTNGVVENISEVHGEDLCVRDSVVDNGASIHIVKGDSIIPAVDDHGNKTRYDAIVVGAGFGGLRMLYELRKLGFSAKVIEAGTGVGGTWFWNRYPGARTDSESWVYIMNFSQELKAEWIWSERYPSQKEVLAYLNHVADRFDMRRDIQFSTRAIAAVYDQGLWHVRLSTGETYTSTYFIPATGLLTIGIKPPFPGYESFRGEWYQTSIWPKHHVDFTNKRIAVVGTGATAVQVIPIVAHHAQSVTVFQRTPNYVLPGRNHALGEDQLIEIKRNYDQIWQKARGHVFGFPMDTAGRTVKDIKNEAHARAILDSGWEAGGYRFVFETLDDLLTNDESNAIASDYIRDKIRAIVKDPETAETLCPRYPFLAKRPPLGHFYFEAFNRPNVRLVDVNKDPILKVTPRGIRTEQEEHEFDMIIYAIGFDAMTGALTQMDIRGKNNKSIRSEWSRKVQTYLGIALEDFPNMFLISGPQSPFANIPVIIDNTVDWIGQAISFMRNNGFTQMETTGKATEEWCEAVRTSFEQTILAKSMHQAGSWIVGANIEGKPKDVLFFFGGLVAYLESCLKEASQGFPNFTFSS